MGVPARLIEFLNQSKVRYEVLHHPEAFTAQELAAIEHVKGRSHAKVVMVKADGEVLMAVLPADLRVDLEKLEKAPDARRRWRRKRSSGRCSPIARWARCRRLAELYGVAGYLDASLSEAGKIVFEAGTHSDAIKMRYADYERVAKLTVADLR
jgi:Ala-tRNA(Pro) deacylase